MKLKDVVAICYLWLCTGENAKLGFCQNDKAMQSTCCTNAIETNLHKAAVGIFYDALRSTVDHLHVTLSDSSSYYQGLYLLKLEVCMINFSHESSCHI